MPCRPSTFFCLFFALPAMLAGRIACAEPAANALPALSSVQHGDVDVSSPLNNTLNITQRSARAVIDWTSFDIGRDAAVDFDQQAGKGSIAVNRIDGKSGDPSRIYGQLTANGTVVILDPNGIIFGGSAKVDTAGLIAATGVLADASANIFATGGALVLSGVAANPAARIENHGSISVRDAGLAAFVAPQVVNSGVISARLGTAALRSGETATIDMHGDGLWSLAVTGNLAAGIAHIKNSGIIEADGGTVYLTAQTAKDAVDGVINNTGLISAQRFSQQDGKIILSAGTQPLAEKKNAMIAGTDTPVQAAIDRAAKDGSTSLYLMEGVYSGGLHIATPMTVSSFSDTGNAHIVAAGGSAALSIHADNVNIEKLLISGLLEAGSVNGLRLNGNIFIAQAGQESLRLNGSSGADITANTFNYTGSGGPVTVEGTSEVLLSGNIFAGSGSYAVLNRRSRRLTLAGNILAGFFTRALLSDDGATAVDDRRLRPSAAPAAHNEADAEITIVNADSLSVLAALAPAAGDETADCTEAPSCP